MRQKVKQVPQGLFLSQDQITEVRARRPTTKCTRCLCSVVLGLLEKITAMAHIWKVLMKIQPCFSVSFTYF